jgi:hypothetical protein
MAHSDTRLKMFSKTYRECRSWRKEAAAVDAPEAMELLGGLTSLEGGTGLESPSSGLRYDSHGM